MDLDQSALAVIDLLMEPSRCFVRIDMFDVASAPAMPSWHIVPIPSAAVSQVGPIAKFALVLSPFPFVQWHSDATLLAASPATHHSGRHSSMPTRHRAIKSRARPDPR